ncbi:MAG: XRE family transcriptional regulator [Haliscomenobacteraceae bacterium CHB4]|nr:hypothetical protein [Saprospiraceae bacterium]MCE7924832.1 XRE family transcriptional regulator [Haliscomenobacteraceae bacterium CHB4]
MKKRVEKHSVLRGNRDAHTQPQRSNHCQAASNNYWLYFIQSGYFLFGKGINQKTFAIFANPTHHLNNQHKRCFMTSHPPADLLEKIRRLRSYCDLSQESVAREMGMTQPAYSKLESGKTRLTVPHLQIFAALVGVSLNDLISCSVDELIHQINDRKDFASSPRE